MLDNLTTHYGEGRCPGVEGFVTACSRETNQPLVSGQSFEVVLDTLEDAMKMKKMVDIQWACITIAAMSGAAGPDDFSDDFSEFDFEREAFEWEAALRNSDEFDPD